MCSPRLLTPRARTLAPAAPVGLLLGWRPTCLRRTSARGGLDAARPAVEGQNRVGGKPKGDSANCRRRGGAGS
eukprot:3876168-Alexandrium_andersonii.AAC.1